MTNNSPSNGNKNKDFPLIMEYKIHFYIKKAKTNSIDYIQISNYCYLKNDINSVKNIYIKVIDIMKKEIIKVMDIVIKETEWMNREYF